VNAFCADALTNSGMALQSVAATIRILSTNRVAYAEVRDPTTAPAFWRCFVDHEF
jgi:hypothetical protein